MKNLLLAAVVILFLGMTSCSGGDEPTGNKEEINKEEPVKYSPVGVWESGNYFVSFGTDNFCSAYFADRYLDCGDYTYNDNLITCSNTYYSKQTLYHIKKLTENQMTLEVEYVDVYGNKQTKSLDFKKSSKPASKKDHSLVGKIHSIYSSTGTQTYTFSTYYTGVRSTTMQNASKYPMAFYYIFFNNRVYYQTFKTTTQMPSIGGWIPTTEITIMQVEFKNDGSFTWSNVTSSAK